jgi:hypothetical protein
VLILREESAVALLEVQVLRSQNTTLLLQCQQAQQHSTFIQAHLGVNDVRLQKLIERDTRRVSIAFGSITYHTGKLLQIVRGLVQVSRENTGELWYAYRNEREREREREREKERERETESWFTFQERDLPFFRSPTHLLLRHT